MHERAPCAPPHRRSPSINPGPLRFGNGPGVPVATKGRRAASTVERDDLAALDRHAVARAQAVGVALLGHERVAVVHLDAETVADVVAAIVLLDVVADRAAGDRAADRRCLAAIALADRVPERAADDTAE